MHELIAALSVELATRMAALPALPRGELTIGIEHEVFAFDEDGAPSEQATQRLLAAWGAPVETSGGVTWAARVSPWSGRGITLKYDHHPHLLELVLEPAACLEPLANELEWSWLRLHTLAERQGVLLDCAPAIADRPGLESPHPAMAALRGYRTQLLTRRGLVDPQAANYAAYIAATQTHVGGLAWWTRPPLLGALLAREPSVAPFAFTNLPITPRQRWSAYARVFEGSPCCGIPRFQRYDLAGWAEVLAHTPMTGDGSTLNEAGLPDGGWDELFARVRDFGVIRPRLFGTVEFRGDPAQPTFERVLAIAALRLGQATSAFDGTADIDESWWQRWLAADTVVPDRAVLEEASQALAYRARDEERYLAPLYNSVASAG